MEVFVGTEERYRQKDLHHLNNLIDQKVEKRSSQLLGGCGNCYGVHFSRGFYSKDVRADNERAYIYPNHWKMHVPSYFRDCLDIKLTEYKRNKKTFKNWTQGTKFCFTEGHTVFDSAKVNSASWSEALPYINLAYDILDASPAIPSQVKLQKFEYVPGINEDSPAKLNMPLS
jgi:hypothetical protein